MSTPSPEAITKAGQALARARDNRDALTPEAAAELAYEPGGPSKEAIAQQIRELRDES